MYLLSRRADSFFSLNPLSLNTHNHPCVPRKYKRCDYTADFFILFISGLLLFGSFVTQAQPLRYQALELEEKTLKAQGRQQTILNVRQFGRYSILAKSEQGTALQYIDRMAGPSVIDGQPGETNGRVDAFLDEGTYKVITHSHARGEGDVALRALPFTELNKSPIQLIDYKLIESELDDFQQRSYWIKLERRKTVILEAAGRSLKDLRIWKDGNWMIADKPVSEVIEPAPGKPLMAQRMIVDLNPGLYLLSAYGGPAQPWAETSEARPFYLRMGIPEIAASARMSRVISPFGVDRWRVPSTSDYFRLELEKPESASLAVGRFNERDVFDSNDSIQFIDKKTQVPVAEIKTYSNDHGLDLVTVKAEAGKTYILQHFRAQKYIELDPGKYWVSSLHSGHGTDSVDVTSMMTEWRGSKERYLRDTALSIDLANGWKRRFNLLDPLTLFFEVKETGKYIVKAEGVDAEYRFEPFLTYQHQNYRAPDFKAMGLSSHLDKGFYKLTVKPRGGGSNNGRRNSKGIMTLTVSPRNANARLDSIAQTYARYNEVIIKPHDYVRIYLNDQPGVTSGIYTRSLPVNLSESLPVTQQAGELLKIPVRIPEEGELSARAEDGSLLDFKLTGAEDYIFDVLRFKNRRLKVKAGEYLVKLENKTDQPVTYQLVFTRKQQLKSTPLPRISQASLNSIPKLPELNARYPQFLDLGRNQQTSYNVRVDSPSLYRLETSGLLQTSGTIRTRVNTRLDNQSNNGVGRNFLIQQYLRQGDYQLSVNTQGQTMGHLGLKLSKTQLIEGGRLIESIPARFTLKSGAGLVYDFEIEKAGSYRIQSYGLNGNARVRLEDADGWPLLKPGIEGDINYSFTTGRYRLVVLPMALESRVVSVFSEVDEALVTRRGRGPFSLALNQSTSHQWIEPERAEKQQTDDWFFELSADSELTLLLSRSMQGSLYRTDENSRETAVADFSDSKAFQRDLKKGRYLLKVSNKKKNSFYDYSISASTAEMLAGERREIYAPATVPVSIGETSLVEISSSGYQDVKAALYDSHGKLIAANDDRAHDWNFDLVGNLDSGKYTLKVQPVGRANAQTAVSVFIPETVLEPQVSLPATLNSGDAKIHIYPFEVPVVDMNKAGIIAVAAESAGAVGMTLEKHTASGWMTVGNKNGENPVFGVVNESAVVSQYRLKVWSPERREMPIKLQIKLLKVKTLNEVQFVSGLKLGTEKLLSHKVSAIKIKLEKPGVFKPEKVSKKLYWARKKQQQLQHANYEFSSGNSDEIWLLNIDGPKKIAAKRMSLQTGQLSFTVSQGSQIWLDAQSRANTLDLFVANSRVGLPGMMLKVLPGLAADETRLKMAAGRQSTAVVTPGVSSKTEQQRLQLWNSHQHIAQLPVTLSQFSFSNIANQQLNAGLNDLSVKAMQAVKSKMPAGLKIINFTLAQGVAAAFIKDGAVEQVLWSDTKDNAHEVSTDAQTLVFYNTHKKTVLPLSVSIQILKVGNRNIVSEKTILRRQFAAAGYFYFDVKLSDAEKVSGVDLRSYGQKVQLLAVDKKGNILSGKQVKLHNDARVSVRHKAGLHVFWLSRAYQSAPERALAELISESNDEVINRKANSATNVLRFNLKSPGLYNVSTSGPVILRRGVADTQEQISVYESAMRDSVFLPAGESYLVFESIDGSVLRDTLYLQKAKRSTLEEGLGEEVSLYPGQARLYSFRLAGLQPGSQPGSQPEKHDIGIGVKASVDIANCTLYSANGDVLGRGVTQKHLLESGQYYLGINLPVDTTAMVKIQPALVGFERPSDGPPEEVMIEYQKLISQKAQ